jgi:hypothetical protein
MIRNYETPEGTISLVDSTSVTIPVRVFTSSTTGGPIAGGVTGRTNAVTTIALCNTAAPSTADETANAVVVNIYIVRNGKTFDAGNLIVSNLTVPAGETVFFSEERIVLESGDQIWVGTSASGRLSATVSVLAV